MKKCHWKTCFFFLLTGLLLNSAEPAIRIVEGTHPAKYEALATTELKSFLEKMTGEEIPVLREGTGKIQGPAIYLGWTEFARKNGIDFSKLGKEEWIVRSAGNSLILSGGRPVGSLYAVYEFLERNGVKFLAWDVTSIPSKKDLTLSGYNLSGKPSFEGRNLHQGLPSRRLEYGISKEVLAQYDLYRLRSRASGESIYRYNPLYEGDLFRFSPRSGVFHNFYKYVAPQKYFKDHPEYFSMTPEGKRFAGTPVRNVGILGSQLCLTNPDVQRITLESIRNFIREDRRKMPKEEWPVLYDISMMDASSFVCCCPECKKVSKEEGGDGGLVVRYINYIASEIRKEYPKIMIRTFAYNSADKAPVKTKPADNVLIQYCDLYTKTDPFRPLTHPLNKAQYEKFLTWPRTGAHLMIWDYWNMGSKFYWPPRLETNVDAIAPDLKTYHENGVKAYFAQCEMGYLMPQTFLELQHYVGWRLLNDLSLDPEKVIREFMEAYYGPAAVEVTQFLNTVREGIRKHPGLQKNMTMKSWSYCNKDFIAGTWRLLKKAEAKTAPGSVYRQRIHALQLDMIWHILFYKDTYLPVLEREGESLESLEALCRKYTKEYVDRFNLQKPEPLWKEFENKLSCVKANLPVPDKFKGYGKEDIRVFGYPHHYQKAPYQCVKDPESPSGFSIRPVPSRGFQGDFEPKSKYPSGRFGVTNVDNYSGISMTIPKEEIPQDEKFHWFKIPGSLRIGNMTQFWGDKWMLTFDLSSAYVNADGAEELNRWEVWFSVKFEGPAYVLNSKKPNAIIVDMIVLTRPEAKKNKE